MKNYLSILLFGIVATGYSQSFEADSVFYAPLEKPNEKKVKLNNESINPKTVGYFFNLQMGPLIGCNDCGKGNDVVHDFIELEGDSVNADCETIIS